jgi:hypothetical protein
MDELCNLLSKTHLSKNTSMDELTNLFQQMEINNNININELTDSFNNMNISEDEIIQIAQKSNNLTEFCYFMLDIIQNRGNKRCYQQQLFNPKYII